MSALTPQIELSNYENLKQVNVNFLNVLKAERKQILDKFLFEKVDLKTTEAKLKQIKSDFRETQYLIEKYEDKIEQIKRRIAKQ